MNKMKHFIGVFLCIAISVFASHEKINLEKNPLLKRIAISEKEITKEKSALGVSFQGIVVPGNERVLMALLEPYLGRELSLKDIEKIKNTIISYYRDNHYLLVGVSIPNQEISDGTLRLHLIEGKLGEINVIGNEWFPSKVIKKYISIEKDSRINDQVLRQDIDFINRNPFRTVQPIFSEGKTPGTTNLDLCVNDYRYIRFFTGSQNNGIKELDQERIFAGLNWGYAFGCDQLLSYQYTASYDFTKFQAHTIDYKIYLPWKNVFNIFGGYSQVNAYIPGQTHSQGYSFQSSLRYVIPLPIGKKFTEELSCGFDYKRTNNTLEFSEQNPIWGAPCDLTQFDLNYCFNYKKDFFKTEIETNFYFSPFKWLKDQTNARYNTLNPGAKVIYFYTHCTWDTSFTLPLNFGLSFQFTGQASTANLLPSEQLGIGGEQTVRGYEENQLLVDNGLVARTEIKTPATRLFFAHQQKKVQERLEFLAFFDVGYGGRHKNLHNLDSTQYLMGIGPGMRYHIDPYLSVLFDWGIRLQRKYPFNDDWQRIHFSVVLGF